MIKKFKAILPIVLKEGFIKANEILWLFCLCVTVNSDEWFENLEKSFPSKFNKEQSELYQRLNKAENENFLESKEDIFTALSIGELAEGTLGNCVTPELRKNLQTKITIKDFRLTDPPDSKLYLSKYKSFYEVTANVNGKWIPLTFTIVEESGEMKILSATIYID